MTFYQKTNWLLLIFMLPICVSFAQTKTNLKNQNVIHVTNDSIYTYVERLPEFAGGNIQQYLALNIHYPQQALDNRIEGRVLVRFIVNKDGKAIHPEILRSVHSSLDSEALFQIEHMPLWKPGEHNGQKVATAITMYIPFSLEKERTVPDSVMPPFFPTDVDGYILEHIKYPIKAWRQAITGIVNVFVLIDEKGRILHPQIVRSVHPELDAEALRIVNSMPKWNPLKVKGIPYKSSVTITVDFTAFYRRNNEKAK